MTFFEEMAGLAHEFLDPGDDTWGEDVVISYPAADSYDSATRKRVAGTSVTQTVRGTFESPGLRSALFDGSAAEKFDRILYAAPLASGGFEPKGGHKVAGEGNTYVVDATDHVKKQGLPILWVCGLKLA